MSDLLLMSSAGGGGLPPSLRRGLVAWYDPWRQVNTTGEAQTLTDYSGLGNHGTLGATTSASTDDPAWTGNSLKFDGVDDVVPIVWNPMPWNTQNGNSVMVVFKTAPDETGYYAVLGSANRRAALTYSYDNQDIRVGYSIPGMGEFALSMGGAFNDQILCVGAKQDVLSATVEVSLYLAGVKSAFRSIAGGWTDNNYKFTHIGYGIYSISLTRAKGDIYLVLSWDRPLTDGEFAQAYAWAKRTLAPRGVTI